MLSVGTMKIMNEFWKLGDYLNCSLPYLALRNLALHLTGCFSKWVCSTQLPHGIAGPDDTVSGRYILTITTGKGKLIQMAWVEESWLHPLTERRQSYGGLGWTTQLPSKPISTNWVGQPSMTCWNHEGTCHVEQKLQDFHDSGQGQDTWEELWYTFSIVDVPNIRGLKHDYKEQL